MKNAEISLIPQNTMTICSTILVFVLFCCLADKVLSTSILWPAGRYGLPMPKSGCPTGNGFRWISGHIYQDLENNASVTTVSPNAHLLGWVSNDVLQFFCIKNQTSTALDNNRKPWPEGDYCIYRKGLSCPAGMLSGSVLWDNENANGMNKNTHHGLLPAGVYNQDTKIFFCCKTTGWYNTPIELPTDKPFYLIAYRPYCQVVLNTVHTMELIVYDTEDDNNHDQTTFPYPYGAEMREPHIYYCYYQACLWTLTTLKGTFTSPYYPQNYHNKASCTWHINVPRNYTISLTFKDFSAERFCCHCDYVEVWETHANGSAVLINEFCDQRKPDLFKPINSSSNNVTVVFYSDDTIKGKGFKASYEAIPVAASHPTAHNIETSTTALPQATTNTTTSGANLSNTPTFQSTINQNYTTPLLFTKTSTRRSSSTPGTEIFTKEFSTTAPEASATTTGRDSVHEARDESAATGNVYVIVGVIASLIAIVGAVVGTVLCFCKKCHIKRTHTDRDSLAVTFTTEAKTEIGISNVSLSDINGGSVSEDKEDECYTDVNKLETVNVLYESGVSKGKDEECYIDINKMETVNDLYDSGDGVVMSEKDDFKESDNPLYASSADTVKDSDNPMYESMDGTLKRAVDAGIDRLYERMV